MRKLLNSLYILEETAYLTLDGENIVCRAEDSEKFRVLLLISRISIFSAIRAVHLRLWASVQNMA